MIKDNEFIEELTKELNPDLNMNHSAIYRIFLPFVYNKRALNQAVSCGILIYEYNRFIEVFKGNLYESDLHNLVNFFHMAYSKHPVQSLDVLASSIEEISGGLKNATQIALLQDCTLVLSRMDLFSNYAFTQIGNIIEGTYKPFLHFFFNLMSLANNDSPHKASLGTYTQKLISWNPTFEHILKTVIYGIEVSQWRNIANHHNYHLISENEIEVSYGKTNIKKQIITREQLEEIFIHLDNTLYLLKTAHTLIAINHLYQLHEKVSASYLVNQDDIKSQIVEASFAQGYIIKVCNQSNAVWNIVVKERIPKPLIISKVIEFVTTITQFVTSDASIEIFDYSNVKIFCAKFEDRKLYIKRLK